MTSEEFKTIKESTGLCYREIADFCGCTTLQAQRWATGGKITPKTEARLNTLVSHFITNDENRETFSQYLRELQEDEAHVTGEFIKNGGRYFK